MAEKIGPDSGSSDLYWPPALTENFGPHHKYARSGRKTPDQLRAHFHWDLRLTENMILQNTCICAGDDDDLSAQIRDVLYIELALGWEKL